MIIIVIIITMIMITTIMIIINVIIDLGGAHSVGDVTGGFLLVPRNFQPIHKLPILLTSAHTVFLTMMMMTTVLLHLHDDDDL